MHALWEALCVPRPGPFALFPRCPGEEEQEDGEKIERGKIVRGGGKWRRGEDARLKTKMRSRKCYIRYLGFFSGMGQS